MDYNKLALLIFASVFSVVKCQNGKTKLMQKPNTLSCYLCRTSS